MNVDKYSRTNLSFDDKDVQKMIEWMKVHPDERPGPRWSDSFSELTFELERAPKSICRWMYNKRMDAATETPQVV